MSDDLKNVVRKIRMDGPILSVCFVNDIVTISTGNFAINVLAEFYIDDAESDMCLPDPRALSFLYALRGTNIRDIAEDTTAFVLMTDRGTVRVLKRMSENGDTLLIKEHQGSIFLS